MPYMMSVLIPYGWTSDMTAAVWDLMSDGVDDPYAVRDEICAMYSLPLCDVSIEWIETLLNEGPF